MYATDKSYGIGRSRQYGRSGNCVCLYSVRIFRLLVMVALVIWPVPIIVLGVRHGYKWSILTTCVAGLLIAILLNPLHGGCFVAGFGLLATTLGYAFRSKYSSAKTLFLGVVAALAQREQLLSSGVG